MAGCARVPQYNIAFAGLYGVGKSTLFAALQKSRCNETVHDRHKTGKSGKFLDKWTHKTTCGPEGSVVEVTVWDTGGMERGSILSITKSYFIQTVAYILVYDTGDLDSLQNLMEWVERAEKESTTIDTSNLVFSLWGNCTDNKRNPVDTVADVPGYACSYNVPPELTFEVNARTGDNIEESYQMVLEAVHSKQTKEPSPFAFPAPEPSAGILKSLIALRRPSWKDPEEEHHNSCPPLSAKATPPHSHFEGSHTDQSIIIPRDDEEEEKKSRCWC